MKKWAFIIDVARCENCHNCFLACKDEHVGNDWPGYGEAQPGKGPAWITIEGIERGRFPLIDVAYLPLPCMHCDDAPCMRAAHDEVIYKRPDGIVIIDAAKAKNRHDLVDACPYGAIKWNDEKGLPQKCTLCAHLIDEGWTKSRCVQACPTGALTLVNKDDVQLEAMVRAENLETCKPELGTRPRVYYKHLYRFTRCFLAGSVSSQINGVEDCVEGATVRLFDAADVMVGETMTDNYGDFKFDGLAGMSGKHMIRIEYGDHDAKSIEVNVEKSLNMGNITI